VAVPVELIRCRLVPPGYGPCPFGALGIAETLPPRATGPRRTKRNATHGHRHQHRWHPIVVCDVHPDVERQRARQALRLQVTKCRQHQHGQSGNIPFAERRDRVTGGTLHRGTARQGRMAQTPQLLQPPPFGRRPRSAQSGSPLPAPNDFEHAHRRAYLIGE